MNAFQIPFALLAFLAFVAVMPPWMWFLNHYSAGLSPETAFIAQLTLPAMVGLFIASWLDPGG